MMAEGTFQDNVACRFFLSGMCTDGERCLFSHDSSRSVPDTACRYYLLGKCIFGRNCWYDHIPLNTESNYETNSVNESMSSAISMEMKKNNSAPDDNNEAERRSSAEVCPYDHCLLIHGNVCELCQKACLHPFNEKARKSRTKKCKKEMESFAIKNSLKETCGICMDVVLEKKPESERRFGLLEYCKHVYCLSCIRKWKQENESFKVDNDFDSPVNLTCPECRIISSVITPSIYFVDTGDLKQRLISKYKNDLNKKHCKYFKKGDGVCPFGGTCFYLHEYPDGTKVDLPIPVPEKKRKSGITLVEFSVINDSIMMSRMPISTETTITEEYEIRQ